VPSLRLDLAFLQLTLAANFAASRIAAYPNVATFTMQNRQRSVTLPLRSTRSGRLFYGERKSVELVVAQ
jgi:hypothetical protein